MAADTIELRVWVYRVSGMEEAVDAIQLDGTEVKVPFCEVFD